jgi:aryl-alcohol dehydrogenase-like predicted oxidoreductase
MMEFILGTVNMGMPYGLRKRQLTEKESFDILHYALDQGIRYFDTAAAYGTAEEVLGKLRLSTEVPFNVFTKLNPNILKSKGKSETIKKCFDASLKRLRSDNIYGYSLHTPKYQYDREVLSSLENLKLGKYIQKTGISVYSEEDAICASNKFDVIQFPFSLLDRRFASFESTTSKLAARTIFLKGLLSDHEPPKKYRDQIKALDEICKWHGITRSQAALKYAMTKKNLDYLVIGVTSVEQLQENIIQFKDLCYLQNINVELKRFDPIIFNSLWSRPKSIFKMQHGRK